MTRMLMQTATGLNARLSTNNEGGYSEALVPFCGLAINEELSGRRTQVVDPFLAAMEASQPPPEFHALELTRLAQMRQAYAL